MSSSFGKSASVMMAGAVGAQALQLAAAPFLTRLYSPEEFGVFSAFFAVASLLVVVATLRLELAIMLPRTMAGAGNVLALSLLLLVGFALMLGLLQSEISAFMKLLGDEYQVVASLVWLLPVAVIVMGLQQVFQIWYSRQSRFVRISMANFTNQSVNVGSAIAFGFTAVGINGLIVARLLGFLSAVVLLLPERKASGALLKKASARGMRAAFVRQRQFPLFNVPYSLVGTFSREMTVLLLTGFGMLSGAGLFGFVRMLLYAPVSLLSQTLGQVYYREAVGAFGTPTLLRLTRTLMRLVIWVFAPPFAVLIVWAPEAFDLVFGHEWYAAGEFAQIFAPAAFLFLLTSWPERIYEIARAQHVSLSIQLALDAVALGSMLWILSTGGTAWQAVAAYSAISGAYSLIYLFGVFRLADFGFGAYVGVLVNIIAALGGLTAVVWGLKASIDLQLNAFTAGAAVAATASAAHVFSSRNQWLELFNRKAFA